jgi:hypothetical protein
MRDETHFKGRSVEVHRCCIYQILIGGQTGFNTGCRSGDHTKRVFLNLAGNHLRRT